MTKQGYDSVFSVVRRHHFRWQELKKGGSSKADKYLSAHIEDANLYCVMFKQLHLTDSAGAQSDKNITTPVTIFF